MCVTHCCAASPTITTSPRTRNPRPLEAIFSRTIPTGIRHGTVTVLYGGGKCEVTTYRTEGSYSDHRRPDSVSFTSSLEEDLARRDFTVNAMAMDAAGNIIDPFGGQDDLKKHILRCVGEPRERFSEDALRMLRAIRFTAQLGFRRERDVTRAIANAPDSPPACPPSAWPPRWSSYSSPAARSTSGPQ